MNFARTLAGVIFQLALIFPLATLARVLGAWSLGRLRIGLDALMPVATFVVLGAVYGVLLGTLWLGRRILVATDQWDSIGLGALDNAATTRWAVSAWVVITLAGFAAVFAVLHGWPDRLVEIAAASCAVFLALPRGSSIRPPGQDDIDEPLPPPLAPQPPFPEPAPAPDADRRTLRFEWYFSRDPSRIASMSERHEVTIVASLPRYRQMRGLPHDVHRSEDYVRFVREGLTPEVVETANGLREISRQARFSPLTEIDNVLAFAQRFPYLPDMSNNVSIEYPKFPLETLVDDGGDCEDHAILAAAVLRRLGYDVCLVDVSYGTPAGHMALAVGAPSDVPEGFYLSDDRGRRYYYCEVTTDGATQESGTVAFRMGQVPKRDRQASLRLLPVA